MTSFVRASPRAWLLSLAALLLLHDAIHSWRSHASSHAASAPFYASAAAPVGMFQYAAGNVTRLCAAQVWSMREDARDMYVHAYTAYVHALNGAIEGGDVGGMDCDELQPLTCTCRRSRSRGTLDDVLGQYALTLVDAMPSGASMGRAGAFRCAVSHVVAFADFNKDVNVSVFEVIIRVLGALISAHMLSIHPSTAPLLWPPHVGAAVREGRVSESDWGCDAACPCSVAAAAAARTSSRDTCLCLTEYSGQLLHLAHDLGKRLLPAFESPTGLPYHMVNLRNGRMTPSEPQTCAAAAATNLLEFAALSALTGDDRFATAAHRALDALWRMKSDVNLIPSSIHVETGGAGASHTGIGAGVDSAWEYMLKSSIAVDDEAIAEMWDAAVIGIGHMDMSDVHVEVGVDGRVQPRPAVFSALQAFYPAALALHGSVRAASSYHIPALALWSTHGGVPDAFDMTAGSPVSFAAHAPLRPEVLEASYHLFMATKDGAHLLNAAHMLAHMHSRSRVECGYASLADVRQDRLDDRCDSYVLAETFKYVWEAANYALVHWCDTHACAKGYKHTTMCDEPVLSRLHGDVTADVARMRPVDDALSSMVRTRFPAAHPLAFAVRSAPAVPPVPVTSIPEEDTASPRVCATTRVWTHDVYAPVEAAEDVRLEPCVNASSAPKQHVLDYAWLPLREDLLLYTTEGHPFMIDLMRPPQSTAAPSTSARSDSRPGRTPRRAGRRTCAVKELEGTPAHPQRRGDGVHLAVNPQFLLQNLPSFVNFIVPRVKLAYAQSALQSVRAAAPSYASAGASTGGGAAFVAGTSSSSSTSHVKVLHDAFSSAIAQTHTHETCHTGAWTPASSSRVEASTANDAASNDKAAATAAYYTSHYLSSTGALYAMRDIAKRLLVETGVHTAPEDVLRVLAGGVAPAASAGAVLHTSLVAVAHGHTRMCVGQWAAAASDEQKPFAVDTLAAALSLVPHISQYLHALAFLCTQGANAGSSCVASVAWNELMTSPQASMLHVHGVPELAQVPASAYTNTHPLVREFHARFVAHAHGRNGGMRAHQHPRTDAQDTGESGTYLLGHPCSFGPLLTPYGLTGMRLLALPPTHAHACTLPEDWRAEMHASSQCDDDSQQEQLGPHFMMVVLRGACSFATKATTAARAHAHALLVLDVVTDVTTGSNATGADAEGMFVMSDDESNAGAQAALPVTMLTGPHARAIWDAVTRPSRCVHACLAAAAPTHAEYARVAAFEDRDASRVAHMYDERMEGDSSPPAHLWSARAHVPHLSHALRQVLQRVSSADAS